MSDPRLLIPPPCEPLSLADAKVQLNLDSDITGDDTAIATAIRAARVHIENTTRRQLVMATYRLAFDDFPRCDDQTIRLYGGPLQSVLAIDYIDNANDGQTLDTDNYAVDADSDPARIVPAADSTGWPATTPQPSGVTVDYAAGFMVPFTADTSSEFISLAAGAAPLDTGQAVRVTSIDGTLPAGLSERTNYYLINGAQQLALTPNGTAINLTTPGTGTLLIDGMPESLRQAMKMAVSYFYENRGNADNPMPGAIGILSNPDKVWRF